MTIRLLIFSCILFYNPLLYCQFTSEIFQLDSNKFQLVVKTKTGCCDSIILIKRFPYPVFKLRQADIDKDGTDDILLGVYKATVLDSTVRTRINIWTVDSNKITAKWLGSFFPHPLCDFELARKNDDIYVLTAEHEQNNLFLVSEYEWHSFGLKFIRFIKRNIPLDEALTIMNNPYEKN